MHAAAPSLRDSPVRKRGTLSLYAEAEPPASACIFIGTQANYQDYHDILGRGLPQADVSRTPPPLHLFRPGRRAMPAIPTDSGQSQPARQRRGLSADVLLITRAPSSSGSLTGRSSQSRDPGHGGSSSTAVAYSETHTAEDDSLFAKGYVPSNKKAGVAAGFRCLIPHRALVRGMKASASCRAIVPLTADCTFSARTSICHALAPTRRILAADASSVIGSSPDAAPRRCGAFARVERRWRRFQRLPPMIELLVLGHRDTLVGQIS